MKPPRRTWCATSLASLALVSLLVSATMAVAQERTRVDLYREDSSRKGHAIIDEKTGRIDTYDKESKRTGYGVVRRMGGWTSTDRTARGQGAGEPTSAALSGVLPHTGRLHDPRSAYLSCVHRDEGMPRPGDGRRRGADGRPIPESRRRETLPVPQLRRDQGNVFHQR